MKSIVFHGERVEFDEARAHLDAEGVPVCNRCGTRLFEYEENFAKLGLGGAIRIRCACELEEEAENEKKYEKVRRQEMQVNMNMPMKYRKFLYFDDLDTSKNTDRQKDVIDVCRQFIDPKNREYNLVMLGSVGTGKSQLAWLMGLENEMMGRESIIITESRLIDEINSASFSRGRKLDRLDEFCEVPFLVIDEIGRTKPARLEDNRQILFDIIDQRTQWERKTVVISNLKIAKGVNEFVDYVGIGVADRLKEGQKRIPLLNWESYRSNG